jgi:hypothetical protein
MIHTLICILLVIACVRALLRHLTRPAPYKMQLVERTPAAAIDFRSLNEARNDAIAAMHDTTRSPGSFFRSLEQHRRDTRPRVAPQSAPDFTDSHLWI